MLTLRFQDPGVDGRGCLTASSSNGNKVSYAFKLWVIGRFVDYKEAVNYGVQDEYDKSQRDTNRPS